MSEESGVGGAGAPRLLLDQNLAPVLARRLADLYPGCANVRAFGLAPADDEAVWAHAAADGFTIVTKDDDFRQRSVLRGAPPRVIWVRLGNGRRRGRAPCSLCRRPRVRRRPGRGAPHPRPPHVITAVDYRDPAR